MSDVWTEGNNQVTSANIRLIYDELYWTHFRITNVFGTFILWKEPKESNRTMTPLFLTHRIEPKLRTESLFCVQTDELDHEN